MQMNADERGELDSLTETVLGAVFEVANTLGAGFLEKVYERALLKELHLRSIPAVYQASFSVVYKDYRVGDYLADILVQNELVLELKCVDRLTNEHIRSMPELPASVRHEVVSFDQLSKANRGMETRRPELFGSRELSPKRRCLTF